MGTDLRGPFELHFGHISVSYLTDPIARSGWCVRQMSNGIRETAGLLRLPGGHYFHSVSAWAPSSSAIGTQSPIIPVHEWTEQGPKLFASPRIFNVLGMLGKLGVAFYISACPFFFYPWINSQCDLAITPLTIVIRPRKKYDDKHAKNKRKNSSAHVDFPFHP